MRSQSTRRQAPNGTAVMRVPASGWYLPVLNAVAAEAALTAGLREDVIRDAQIVTGEIVTALCLRSTPDAVAEVTFEVLPRALRVVGKAPTGDREPPERSAPVMELLHRVAHEVSAVCLVDHLQQTSLWMTATVSMPEHRGS